MIKRYSAWVAVGKNVFEDMKARKIELDSGDTFVDVKCDASDREPVEFIYSLPDDSGDKLKKQLESKGIFKGGTSYGDLANEIRTMCIKEDFMEVKKEDSFNKEFLKEYLTETKENKKFIWKRQLLTLHSLSSPLNEIYNCYSQRYNPVILVTGDSSTGKSSACRYIQSLSCDVKDSRYTTDMTDTRTALIQRMTDIKGFPVLLDDTSNRSNTDFETLIYNLSTGKEKERAGQRLGDYIIKGGRSFDSNVTITGEENPLLGKRTKSGIEGRLIILKVHLGELTDSKTHSRVLSKESEHYGNNSLRDEIVKLVLRDGKKAVFDKMYNLTEEVSKGVTNNILDRWSRYYAVLRQTAKYLDEILGIKFDMDAIECNCNAIIQRRIKLNKEFSIKEQFNDFYEAAVVKQDKGQTNSDHIGITAKSFGEIVNELKEVYGNIKPEIFKRALYEDGILESAKSKVVNEGSKASGRYYYVAWEEGDSRKPVSDEEKIKAEMEALEGKKVQDSENSQDKQDSEVLQEDSKNEQ